jgi:hypothetical protein
MQLPFNEREFEFCFNSEWVRKNKSCLLGTPVIPTTNAERFRGYDVGFEIKRGRYHRSLFLARHYADNTTVLGFEIMNEPNPEAGDSQWHAIAQQVINAIRTVDQHHLIFVDGRSWSSSEHRERVNGPAPFVQDPISPPRLVYVPHIYFSPENNDRYEGVDANLQLMRQRLEPLANWSRRNEVPVWIGESGVPNTPKWAALLDCAFIEYYDPLGWGHLYWEDSEWSTDMTRLGPYTLAVLQHH